VVRAFHQTKPRPHGDVGCISWIHASIKSPVLQSQERCEVCQRAKKGRCGTASAPWKCQRRAAAGLPTSPPVRGAQPMSDEESPSHHAHLQGARCCSVV